jgi:PRC-barrel domain protein
MGAGRGTGSFRRVGDRYDGYTVVDADGDKIGTVDTTYVNETNQSEYVAVRRGLAGLIPGTGSSIIPMDVCAVDNTSRTIQASTHKDTVKNSPSLSTSQEMTPEYEGQVRSYYRL